MAPTLHERRSDFSPPTLLLVVLLLPLPLLLLLRVATGATSKAA